MRNSSAWAIAVVATTLGAVPASAQSDPEEKRFDGPYVAISGGYDLQANDIGSRIGFDRNGDGQFGDTVTTAAGDDAFQPGFCKGRAVGATPAAGCRNDRSTASYSGRIGFDRQYGPFVIGIVGEFGKSGAQDYVSAFSVTPASYSFSRSVDWEASGRLRAGYAVNGGLFYATGGIGYARLKHRFETTNSANSFSTLTDDRDRKGFIVGGGTEYMLTPHISIGAEYTYHDYKDDGYQVRAGAGSAAATNPFILPPDTSGTTFARSDTNFRWHALRATLGFHF